MANRINIEYYIAVKLAERGGAERNQGNSQSDLGTETVQGPA